MLIGNSERYSRVVGTVQTVERSSWIEGERLRVVFFTVGGEDQVTLTLYKAVSERHERA